MSHDMLRTQSPTAEGSTRSRVHNFRDEPHNGLTPDWTRFDCPHHTAGMTGSEKIAVSLPRGLAERARRAVRQGRAPNVSAYVASALEEKVKLEDLSALLDETLAESVGR